MGEQGLGDWRSTMVEQISVAVNTAMAETSHRLEACIARFCEQEEVLMKTLKDDQLRYQREVRSSLSSIMSHDATTEFSAQRVFDESSNRNSDFFDGFFHFRGDNGFGYDGFLSDEIKSVNVVGKTVFTSLDDENNGVEKLIDDIMEASQPAICAPQAFDEIPVKVKVYDVPILETSLHAPNSVIFHVESSKKALAPVLSNKLCRNLVVWDGQGEIMCYRLHEDERGKGPDKGISHSASSWQRKREQLLQGLGWRQGLAADGGDRIVVNQPVLEDLEDVEEEEDGLACMVCREGYSLRPTDLLGVYTYIKRVNLGVGTSRSAREDCVYTTVSHFNIIHSQCHQEAKRAYVALRNPKKEWEGAALRDNETLCNNLYPLRGPFVPLTQYMRYIDQYWDYLDALGRANGSRLRLLTYDIVLILARFATGASFSTDSRGGGKESNSKFLPFMIQNFYPGGEELSSLQFTTFSAIDKIRANQTITDGNIIVSAGRNFELGFFSAGSSKNMYLDIWYMMSKSTICVAAILGSTLNGEFEDVKLLNDLLLEKNQITGWDTPIHVDAMSGGFIVLVSTNGILSTGGQFLSYLLNLVFTQALGTWRWRLGNAGLPALVQFVMLLSRPKSPRWLYRKGREEEAEATLRRMYPAKDVDAEIQVLKELVEDERKAAGDLENVSFWTKMKTIRQTKIVKRGLIADVGLQVFQQFVSINTVMYYSPTIVQLACFASNRTALLFSPMTSGLNALGSIVSIYFIERTGRKKLLAISLVGLVISLMLLSAVFQKTTNLSPLLETHNLFVFYEASNYVDSFLYEDILQGVEVDTQLKAVDGEIKETCSDVTITEGGAICITQKKTVLQIIASADGVVDARVGKYIVWVFDPGDCDSPKSQGNTTMTARPPRKILRFMNKEVQVRGDYNLNPNHWATWEEGATTAQQFSHSHLEDKVVLGGRGNVMHWPNAAGLSTYTNEQPKTGPWIESPRVSK